MKDVIILDVRTLEECNRQRIIDSIELPLSELQGKEKMLKKLLLQNSIILICSNGKRSELAKQIISKHFPDSNIAIYEGGIQMYQKNFPENIISGGIGCNLTLVRQVQLLYGALLLLFILGGVFLNSWFLIGVATIGIFLMFTGTTGECNVAKLLGKLSFNKGNSYT